MKANHRKKIIIAGGSGFLGSALRDSLHRQGYDVLTLSRRPTGEGQVAWLGGESWQQHLAGAAAVINLAGANIGGSLWTAANKAKFTDSRVHATRALSEAIRSLPAAKRPPVFLQASAIGIYGDAKDPQQERPAAQCRASGFLPGLCRSWENSVALPAGVKLRVARIGLVLGREGGMLKKILPVFRFGLGGWMGSGHQIMSWIHLADAVGALEYLLFQAREKSVIANITSPQPQSGGEFFRTLGSALHRPVILPVPAAILKRLPGAMGEELFLRGQNAPPEYLQGRKFAFRFPGLREALADLLAQA